MNKQQMKKQIWQYDFSIKELELYLDTHPDCQRALYALREMRKIRSMKIAQYEKQFGKYILTSDDAPAESTWQWINSPWPWEREVDC